MFIVHIVKLPVSSKLINFLNKIFKEISVHIL